MINNTLKKAMTLGIIATSLLVVNPVGASAEWKQDSTGWWYTEGDSYAKGWRSFNGNWYYFDLQGYMKTGWFAEFKYNTGGNYEMIDQTYYYLNGDGILDSSKTAKTLPDEIKKAYDIVANFEKDYSNELHFDGTINKKIDSYKQLGFSYDGAYSFEVGDAEATYDQIDYDTASGKVFISNQGRCILFDSNKSYDSIDKKANVINKIREWQSKLPNCWQTILNVTEDENTYKIEKYDYNYINNYNNIQYDTQYSYSKENGEITKK